MIRFFVIIFALSFTYCIAQKPAKKSALEKKADKIHNKILTLDSHTDTPLRFLDQEFNISKNNGKNGKIDFPRMKEGGLDAAFFAVFLSQKARTEDENKKAIEKAGTIFDAIYREIQKYPEMGEIAFTPRDAYRLKKEGKSAVYIGIENGYAIGHDTSLLKKYFDTGARYMTLCHSKNNDICDSANDTIEHGGLSKFGAVVVKEMNKLGMIIDISHASDSSFYDVIKLSTKPIIASHSCSRAICDNKRNMSDDMLIKLKENGGVIQMCILSDYVKAIPQDPARDSAEMALREKYKGFKNLSEEQYKQVIKEWYALDELYPQVLATVKDVVDHIDHIVKVAGIDHVGIGTDFDGGGGVEDCNDASMMKNITIELLRRGYSEKDIQKIWSGNFMRVFNEVLYGTGP